MKQKQIRYTPRHAAPDAQAHRPEADPARDPEPKEQIRRYRQKRRRRKERRRRALLLLLAAVFTALFMLSLFMLGRSLRRDELKGVWMLDENTVYEFDGRGQGVLRLPLGSYAFSYTLRDNTLTIDFTDETAADAAYFCACNGPELTLESYLGTVYHLQRQK